MKIHIIALLILIIYASKANAEGRLQENSEADSIVPSLLDKISIGAKGGIGFYSMRYSNEALREYDASLFTRGLGGIFIEFTLSRHFSLRPEFLWLGRGQKIDDKGIYYRMKSKYFDFRLPVLYTFGQEGKIRPYITVAPVVSFSRKGEIEMEQSGHYYTTDITKANLASTSFGIQAGAGVKFPFRIKNFALEAGVEASYHLGLTNTYGNEKDHTPDAINTGTYHIDGKRRNRGTEIAATIAVPLKNFKRRNPRTKKVKNTIADHFIPTHIPAHPIVEPKQPEKDFYTVEELTYFAAAGYDVRDRKISVNTLNFEFGKSTLDRTSENYLDKIVALMNETPDILIKIIGHTDDVGSDEFNMKLSEQRAKSVYNYLIRQGIDKQRLDYAYFGSRQPLNTAHTEKARAINRRVEFLIKGEAGRNTGAVTDTIYYRIPSGQAEINGTSESKKPVRTEKSSKIVVGHSDVDLNIPVTNTRNERTFVMVIANERYEKEEPVMYASSDGKVFREYCQKTLGIPEANIYFVENATRNNILAGIDWLGKVAEAYKGKEKIIFYYAGHGIPDEKNREAYLLPVDGYGSNKETGYPLSKLYDAFGKMPAESITVFLDACFSGARREGGMLVSARGVALEADYGAPSGKTWVFSAATADETASPYKEKGHGLFTYFLLKKWQETKGNVSYKALADYVIDQVRQYAVVANKKSQTPMVIPSFEVESVWNNWKFK